MSGFRDDIITLRRAVNAVSLSVLNVSATFNSDANVSIASSNELQSQTKH